MPLPNPNQPIQQEGINPNTVTKRGNLSQKTEESLSIIESRLSNITNIRTSVQQGAFTAFGSNFLTRAGIQGTEMIGDLLSNIFSDTEQQREKKDPIQEILKGQTKLLEGILTSVNMPKEPKEEKSRETKADDGELSLLREILDVLKEKGPFGGGEFTKPRRPRRKRRSRKLNDEDTIVDVEATVVDEPIDLKQLEYISQEELDATHREERVFGEILDILIHSDETLSKMASGPISSQEAELEADKAITKASVSSAEKLREDGTKQQKDGSIIDNILAFMGMGALKDIIGKVATAALGLVGAFSSGALSLASAIGSVVKSILTTGWELAKAGIQKGIEMAKQLGSKILEGGKAVISAGTDLAKKGAEKAIDIAKTIGGKASDVLSAGKDIVKSGASKAMDVVKSVGGKVVTGASELLGAGADMAKKGIQTTIQTGKDISGKAIAKAGDIISAGTDLAKKGAGEATEAVGKGLGKAASVGKKFTKFLPGVGAAVMAGDIGMSAVEGFGDAEKILGIEGREATGIEKGAAATGGAVESLTMGLIKKEDAARFFKDMADRFTDASADKPQTLESKTDEVRKAESLKKSGMGTQDQSTFNQLNSTVNNQTIFPSRNVTMNAEPSFNRYIDNSLSWR